MELFDDNKNKRCPYNQGSLPNIVSMVNGGYCRSVCIYRSYDYPELNEIGRVVCMCKEEK